MTKFEKARLILKEHQTWRLGGDDAPTNPQVLTGAINTAIEALDLLRELRYTAQKAHNRKIPITGEMLLFLLKGDNE